MSTSNSSNDNLFQKAVYGIQYIFIYYIILSLLFLLVIPVLNISPFVMIIVITMGMTAVYVYNSKFLSLILISLWASYICSYNLFHSLYNGGRFILEFYNWLSLILLIYLFIIYMQISNDINITEPKKLLYLERQRDLKRIEEIMTEQSVSILGIESNWGMGKTLLIDHFMFNHRNDYIFIRIDTIALNLDDVIEYLVQQIAAELDSQYIFNKTNRKLVSYINSFKYGPLVTDLLATETTYSAELNKLKDSLTLLNKSIIIVFEDLDRIDNKEVLRKLLYISERLTLDVQGKLKVIYQYSAEELEKKGFNYVYLQKYIPNTVSLTNISFVNLFNYIIDSNSEKYQSVLKYRYIIDKITNPIINWYGYSENIIDPLLKERYLSSVYNIRNIGAFVDALAFYIDKFSDTISNNKQFDEILVKTCYIKYFLNNFYQTISTNIDLQSNFCVEYNNKVYYLLDVIAQVNDEKKSKTNNIVKENGEIKNLFSPTINPINLEKFLAFCVLELYFYDIHTMKLPDSRKKSIQEQNYNSSMDELNRDFSIKLNCIEHYFYYCIAEGNKAESGIVEFTNHFVKEVLNKDNIDIIAYTKFMDKAYKEGYFENQCFIGIATWAAIFKSFYYAAINWNVDIINKHYNKLILYFFECYITEFKSKLELYIFRNLNIFLSAVQNYNLKESFFTMIEIFNRLEINDSFRENTYFIAFQENIIKTLISLDYIESKYRTNLSGDIFVSAEEITTDLLASFSSIKIEINKIIDELNHTKEYNCLKYNNQLKSILKLIDKLCLLNKTQSEINNDDEYTEKKNIDNTILSDEELREGIKNNTIGARQLYDELKRRSISNTSHN